MDRKSNGIIMYCIQDLTFELDTGLEYSDDYTTPIINGKIEAIIVDIPQGTLDLSLYFDGMTDIILFEKFQLKGQQYIPIRVDTISNDANKFNFTQDKWAINNRLYCLVEGNINIKAIVTIRYSTEIPK